MFDAIGLYEKYYIKRDYEQIDLFQLLDEKFVIEKVIYPGSFVQISPAFVFQKTVFIDSDGNAKKFFESNEMLTYISQRKEYLGDPEITFFAKDYKDVISDLKMKFDLLISQYAGFISEACKDYLKIGGFLLVNNSHGDAGLASIDPDYELVAAIGKSGGTYRLSTAHLDRYFIPKKEIVVSRDYLVKSGRGVGYSKTASLYLFQRQS